jgi:hypothetical protein
MSDETLVVDAIGTRVNAAAIVCDAQVGNSDPQFNLAPLNFVHIHKQGIEEVIPCFSGYWLITECNKIGHHF